MPEPLRYKYAQGDTIVYDIIVSHEITEPEGESLSTMMALRSTTTVERAEPNLFVCSVATVVLDTEGLAAMAEAPDLSQEVRYCHDARGHMRPLPGAPGSVASNLVFPEEALSPGQGWDYVDEGPARQPTRFKVTLVRLTEQDDDTIAVLTTQADLAAEADATGKLQSEFHFSITRGRRLWSRTEIRNVYTSGRVMQSTVEVHLDPTT